MSTMEFNSLVVFLSGNLQSYALNLTKNGSDAKDLIQETMYRALVNKDKFSDGTNMKAWLFTIMKNIFINAYRRKSKRKTIIDSTDNQYYINLSKTVKNQAETNFVMEDLMNAVNRLTDEYKVPFMMHYKGYKYQEIAEDLSLPLGTVKSRIFFARKELKSKVSIYREKK